MTVLTVNSRKARSEWRDLLDDVLTGDIDIIIERNGKAVAAMIPIEDFREIQEELDDLRAARRAASLYEAWKLDRSLARPLEDIENELIAEGKLDERGKTRLED